jgi:hypothetical protein
VSADPYPEWFYYPSRSKAPQWVHDFVGVVAASRTTIDSEAVSGLSSNSLLAALAPGLAKLGYQVELELSSRTADRIRRPVLFGEGGRERVAYHVDAVHDGLGVLDEVEAGRGARGNAVYRDLVRSSLIVDRNTSPLVSCGNTDISPQAARSSSEATTSRRTSSIPFTRVAG